MKKFAFPLGRVLDFREMQTRIEESKLEQLYGELRGIEASEAVLRRQRAESEQDVLASGGAPGLELAALDSFRQFTAAEHRRLENLRRGCRERIAAQIQLVAAKRRAVRLLERLREQRRSVWSQELNRELDAQAEEAFLAQWNRERK